MDENGLQEVGNSIAVEERSYGKTTTINFLLQKR